MQGNNHSNNTFSSWLCLTLGCHSYQPVDTNSDADTLLLQLLNDAKLPASPGCWETYGSPVFWWSVYIISSVQPGLNAWNAGSRLMYNTDCSVGDFLCYGSAAWKDAKSIIVWLFILCTFLDNVAIARVFMPEVIETLFGSDKSKPRRTWSQFCENVVAMITFENFISMLASRKFYAFMLAAACSLITYKLGIDSLTIFQTTFKGQGQALERFGLALDLMMLSPTVFSAFSTRMVGCETMLGVFLLWMPYLYFDKLFSCFFQEHANEGSYLQKRVSQIMEEHPHKRVLLDVMHRCSLHEYNVDAEVRRQYLVQMNTCDYESALDIAYNNNLLGLSGSMGENIFYACIQAFKAICYFIAVACYPVVYNITYGAFARLSGWLETSYAAATANILFYMYALGRLADQSYRTCKMHLHSEIKSGGLWTVGVLGVLTAFGCANLLATALIEAQNGQLDRWIFTHEEAAIFFPIVLALVSGLTNGFGLARIDRLTFDKHLTASKEAGEKWVQLINESPANRRAEVARYLGRLSSNPAIMYTPAQGAENPMHANSTIQHESV